MSNLFVEDKDIKVSKSSFSIYENETIKYEGRVDKLKMDKVTVILQRDPKLCDALSIEILRAVYELRFSTSRQITQYLQHVRNIEVEQSVVCKKLDALNRFSIVTRYSFTSDERTTETNMKIYSLDNNGKIILKGRRITCNWKYTDVLMLQDVKMYLVRNQFIIKAYETKKLSDVNINPQTAGVGAIYKIGEHNHIIIPVRKNENYKEDLLNTYESLKKSPEFLRLINAKTIIIGENDTHLFEIFKILAQNKLLTEKTLFTQDLRLFDKIIQKSFVKFAIKPDTNPPKVVLTEVFLEEFV